jgi:AraC family transcriptional regulator, ethanolamine operon transcriptional activator
MSASALRASPPLLECLAFADIDEQAAALTGWNQRYLQLSAGRFVGAVRRMRLDDVGLFVEDLHQSVHQTGFVDDGVIALGVPLVLHGETRFCGAPSTADQLHVFSGDAGFEFRSPQRHLMLGIEIAPALFAARVAGPAQFDAHTFVAQARLRRIEPQAMDRLRQALLALLSMPGGPASAAGTDREAATSAGLLRDLVLDRLCAALASDGTDPPPPPRPTAASRARVVERATHCVRERLHQPPSVAELCELLGVSRRTLQTGFQDAWGMGPLAWLRVQRLNAVRRVLKTAPSVTAGATQLGFWHFGRFSHDYWALFGELPSQTFRRHHPATN